ncbi:MAG: elongation factor 4, partial [Candidatus Kerfeldbacteria bacterium]|nr:elongation factor 4 [Candidatus Kerfeldbacteria bacterium]
RGTVRTTEYLGGSGSGERMMVVCDMPLANVITNFYDIIKSRTSGFASLFYEFAGFREADIVRVDILLAGERAEALSTLVVRSDAERAGRAICVALQHSIPPQQFEIRIQAALGGRIIASERIAPLRKDVTAKLYGGDVTRKRKLLEKQKKGKKRMREHGRVDIPPEAYLAVVKKDSPGVQ